MDENGTNVFGVIEPDDYRCHIVAFVDDIPSILIRAHKANPKTNQSYPHFCLEFAGVIYWEGPTWWAGADFQIGTYDEMMAVLEKWFVQTPTLEILNHPFLLLPDKKEHLQRHFRLYKVKSLQGGEVKIIAREAKISDVMPESWKSLLYPKIR